MRSEGTAEDPPAPRPAEPTLRHPSPEPRPPPVEPETRCLGATPAARAAGDPSATDTQPAPPAEVTAAAARPHARLSHYVLVEKIGEGGMGEVHKAWDRALGRWVAVKLLKTRDEEMVQRFLREANLAAQFSHPNVTRVYEAGVDGERVFLAMELIDGAVPLDRRSAGAGRRRSCATRPGAWRTRTRTASCTGT